MSDSVSVVMPVRNEINYIDQSIASILAQSHRKFEFVIGDDGSTDGTYERLTEWAGRDSRIRLIGPSNGLGPAGSSNWVVSQARHPIVARMDGDDISHPERLTKQLRILHDRPEAVLVGTMFDSIDGRGRRVRGPQRAKLADLDSCAAPFAHGSIMFRRNAFYAAGGYRADCSYWEDMEFFWRMASVGRLFVLSESLYRYRNNLGSGRVTAEWSLVSQALRLCSLCAAAHKQGSDYSDILASDRCDDDNRNHLDALIALGSIRLWSGYRPRILWHILRLEGLVWNSRTIAAIIWAAAADLSPALARSALRSRSFVADCMSITRWAGRQLFEWHPPQAAVQSYEASTRLVRSS